MVRPVDMSAAGGSSLDLQQLGKVRFEVRQGTPEAMSKVAREFEALLLNTMLKSMREAGPKGGIFDSSENRMFTAMFDQQIAQDMAKAGGIGLADMLMRQVQGSRGLAEALKDGPVPPLNRS